MMQSSFQASFLLFACKDFRIRHLNNLPACDTRAGFPFLQPSQLDGRCVGIRKKIVLSVSD